ncbi:MAG: hypothetical protein A3B86_04635 [Candidatus Yanofskybacteria bacterium RIFCSPHIGHO2_02_FULL_38_22b]|uniref:Uncharacterized protein n=1 Tax=Candidatus Yanofskybacteria bacterium RIFCSPHIGHO2_02_FULL_38_22b TaxID=1802673 RepID=A0A1F8F0N4_9BACT|nr:MAG: hypothetical protein A3B86_04635 [Candidatus Yanofskybacteria bacterium RIFCSPHIGHO2_02_FULL_38_22b]
MLSKNTGKIKLKIRIKQAVKNIPPVTKTNCFFSVPWAIIDFCMSRIIPEITKLMASKLNKIIPNPSSGIATWFRAGSVFIFENIKGVKESKDVKITAGKRKNLNHTGNIIFSLGKM